jgi:hypothetical protein
MKSQNMSDWALGIGELRIGVIANTSTPFSCPVSTCQMVTYTTLTLKTRANREVGIDI